MTATITDKTVLGYEGCRECGWKNIFWADQGDPQPQLIASLRICGGFVCPMCRAEAGHRTEVGPVPASVLFDSDELVEMDHVETEDPSPSVARRMTFRQHFRAFVRWWSPWVEETREYLVIVTGFFLCFIFLGLALRDTEMTLGAVSVYWFGLKLFLLWRAAITVLLVLLSFKGGWSKAKETWKGTWREYSAEPLLPHFRQYRVRRHHRRTDTAWLRSRGYTRREARKSARLSDWWQGPEQESER